MQVPVRLLRKPQLFPPRSYGEDGPSVSRARKRRRRRQYIATPPDFLGTPVSDTQIDLTWSKPVGLYVQGYKILRNGVEISDYPAQVEIMGELIDNEPFLVADSGLVAETTYTYQIHAYNQYGGMSETATIEATTQAAP